MTLSGERQGGSEPIRMYYAQRIADSEYQWLKEIESCHLSTRSWKDVLQDANKRFASVR